MHGHRGDQIVVARTGVYLIASEIVWAPNATGGRFLSINTNTQGELMADTRTGVAGTDTVQTATTLARLTAGTAVSLAAGHGVGSDLATAPFNGRSAALNVQ